LLSFSISRPWARGPIASHRSAPTPARSARRPCPLRSGRRRISGPWGWCAHPGACSGRDTVETCTGTLSTTIVAGPNGSRPAARRSIARDSRGSAQMPSRRRGAPTSLASRSATGRATRTIDDLRREPSVYRTDGSHWCSCRRRMFEPWGGARPLWVCSKRTASRSRLTAYR